MLRKFTQKLLRFRNQIKQRAANNGISALLVSEYKLIDTVVNQVQPTSRTYLSFGIYRQLSIFEQQQYRTKVTQNMSTAESPWTLPEFSLMKYLTILLFCGVLTKNSLCQSNRSALNFGKYEGIELIYFKHASDTSRKVDRMNETWGKKTLTIDSNGTFLLEFPVPYPTTTG
jgi:hypothetical protein